MALKSLKTIPTSSTGRSDLRTAEISPKRSSSRQALAPFAAFAVIGLTACSAFQRDARPPQVWATLVDASTRSADAISESRVYGGVTTQKISAGLYWQVAPDMFVVRKCDASTGICRRGIAKPVVRVTLRDVSPTGATVTLQTEYHVGPTQTMTNGLPISPVKATMSIGAGAAPMPEHTEVTLRTAEVPYGQLRKVSLPNGVTVGLCLSNSPEPFLPPNGACPAGTDLQHLGEALVAAAPF